MTRACCYALAVLVGLCSLGHMPAWAQSGPPGPANGGSGAYSDPAMPPDGDPSAYCETPWYGNVDEVQAASRTLGPLRHFDGAFVRVEYLNYTISKPGNALLGAPPLGVVNPTQPFEAFAPGTNSPVAVATVPTTNGISLGSMSGLQVTGGLNLIDDGTIEVGAFMLARKESGYIDKNLGGPFDLTSFGDPGISVPLVVATSLLQNGQPSANLLLYNQSFQATFQSQLWGAEANYLCDVNNADAFRIRPLLGGRYINLAERLTQTGVFQQPETTAPPTVTTIDSRTTNNLYGGQIGFRMEVVTKYLEFGVTPKILFLGDTMLSQVSTDHLRSNFDGNVASQNLTSTFTFGGDATSYVQLNLSQNFSIRGGYNVLYINRVTRPQNNIYYNDNGANNPPGVVSNLIMRDVLISGFTVGCQFRW